MSNPQRFRIEDATGCCFDSFLNCTPSKLERDMRRIMISKLTSVRPLDAVSAHYAAVLLNASGFIEGADYEVEELSRG